MKVTYSRSLNARPDVLLCPVFEEKEVPKYYDSKIKKIINELNKNKLFSGKSSEVEVVHSRSSVLPKVVCFVGLGKKSKLDAAAVRNSFAGAVKTIMQRKVKKVGVYMIPDIEKYTQMLAEAIALVNYSPAKYKTGKEAKKVEKNLFSQIYVIAKSLSKDIKQNFDKGVDIANAVHLVRDLINGPSNIVSVENFANEAKNIAKDNKYKIDVHDKAWLQKKGMGAILSVNQGSGDKEAKLVILEYEPKGIPNSEKKPPILLVGKGLIFDSGGYNLKPTKHIEDMQQDKAGGSVVLGVFKLLKSLDIKRRVIGIIPVTENLLDANSQKPSDIITSYTGKTIEIRNTDAEGRMILADGIAYGIEKYEPEYAIDVATLTGACMIALGDRYAGVMGNDEELIDEIIKAGNDTDELVWKLPLHKDFSKIMKGKLADLRNIDDGTSHLAGASKAAAFLQYFIGKTKWAHLDIAGTAFTEKPKACDQPKATGYGVRLLIQFLENAD